MSIATTWLVRGRQAVGLTADPASSSILLPWSADPSLFPSGSMPWVAPAYPVLLVAGLGLSVTTSASVGNRRLSLQLDQPGGAQLQWLSSGTQAASLTRRWEVALGFALETTLAGTVYREPLPHGFLMFPGLVGGAEAQLTVTLGGVQAGDVLGPLSIRGFLLPA